MLSLALAWTNGEYRVTWPGGTAARFDSDRALQRLENGFGVGLTFANVAGKLAAVTHDNGKALAFSYTGDRLTRVDLPSTNLYLTFAYSADGVSYAEQYEYENVCHVLTQKVNAAGDAYDVEIVDYH